MWKLYEIQISLSVNKVLLQHIELVCSYTVYGSFHMTAESWWQRLMTHKD